MAASVDDLLLTGRRIGITADRRWEEQARLFEARRAEIVHGPTMKTVDLTGSPDLRAATDALLADPPEVLVATTGMGMRMWLAAAVDWKVDAALLAALRSSQVVCRGAKSSSAVKGAGLEVSWRAPGETMAEVVAHVMATYPGRRTALQLFDPDGDEWTEALGATGATVVEVPVYRWLLPVDRGPAYRLIDAAIAGTLDAVTFTSQPAVRHLFRLAADLRPGADDHLRAALNGPVLPACIGPVCAEAALECGIARPVWPEPNRMPAMVRQVTERLAGETPNRPPEPGRFPA